MFEIAKGTKVRGGDEQGLVAKIAVLQREDRGKGPIWISIKW
jgi:hypothetical protein